jgi:hypothetical protein
METGMTGQTSLTALMHVAVEHRTDPDFATIPHLQTEEKNVQEHQRKIKTATHMIVQV